MNGNLTIIEPKNKSLKSESEQSLKVCAYCRVSTSESDQRNSLQSQKRFFDNVFASHPNWVNVGIFADEGISGTSLNKRDKFNEMILRAKKGEIDLIFTKEVSRFARNVKDLLNIVEELREKDVFVYFLTDNINTEENNYREKLSQVATNAEIESLRTSRRVQWGQAERMKQGIVFGRKEMYGYNIVKDDLGLQHFEIIEEEAKTIKMIFELFAEGYGTYKISKKLQEMGVKTKRYKNGWTNTVILRILRNEKYVGDLNQGKTYTPDALTHKKKYNFNNAPMYYIKNHHPESAIIDRDLWDKVQRILEEKAPDEETKAKHSNRYWCSGKIYCGECGARFISHRKKQKSGIYKSWVCLEHNQRGTEKIAILDGKKEKVGCDNKPINDRILRQAIHDIITEIIIPNKKEICNQIVAELQTVKNPVSNTKKINSITKKIDKLESDLTRLVIKYNNDKISEYEYKLGSNMIQSDISELAKEKAFLEHEERRIYNSKDLSNEFIKKVNEIVNLSNDKINDDLYEKITKKIIVNPDKTLEIYLSFLPRPICMSYEASGKMETYNVKFRIMNI